MLSNEKIRSYMARIGYNGPLYASLETLRALQRSHVNSVPFENLDIHLGRHIPVDVDHAFDKVVGRRRGGICFELNPLFHQLLVSLGFDAKVVSARILLRDEGTMFDHIAIVVHLGGLWLVDVGYGRQPPVMPIGPTQDAPMSNADGVYHLRLADDEYVLEGSTARGSFERSYGFHLIWRSLQEFEERAGWLQTSPDSIFTKAPICSMPSQAGRLTISGFNLISTSNGETTIKRITGDERAHLLKDAFGIDLDGQTLRDDTELLWVPGRAGRPG